jgi:DNA-binding winged helix-turn-helix (wHTH) protein
MSVPDSRAAARYRFGEFTLVPRRRLLLRGGATVPLIPKYFDLLQLLIERRHEALDRREIFDRVWADVVVTDGALSQAVRTLRRVLQDDPRTPRYIRTVSRHGYQFVFEPVIVDEDAPAAAEQPEIARGGEGRDPGAQYDVLLSRVLRAGSYASLTDAERREAAEQLHLLGTREALERLDARAGHAQARAFLRDARWDVPGAGEVPLLAAPDPLQSITALVALRLRGAMHASLSRLGAAAAGGAFAGVVAGAIGGAMLMLAAEQLANLSMAGALMIVGGLAGTLGAAGVGAGLADGSASPHAAPSAGWRPRLSHTSRCEFCSAASSGGRRPRWAARSKDS